MSLLGGEFQTLFAEVFGPEMHDGFLHVVRSVPDGEGGYASTTIDTRVKGMVEAYSEGYRTRAGIPDTDVKVTVLQAGVRSAPNVDSEVTMRGRRYRVMAVDQDPARVGWIMRGRPV